MQPFSRFYDVIFVCYMYVIFVRYICMRTTGISRRKLPLLLVLVLRKFYFMTTHFLSFVLPPLKTSIHLQTKPSINATLYLAICPPKNDLIKHSIPQPVDRAINQSIYPLFPPINLPIHPSKHLCILTQRLFPTLATSCTCTCKRTRNCTYLACIQQEG